MRQFRLSDSFKRVFIIGVFFLGLNLHAQEEEIRTPAVFPGGIEALQRYVSKNLKYPKEAYSFFSSARVIVNFVVDYNGIVQDVNVAESGDVLLDSVAIHLVRNMPAWTPGTLNDEPIDVSLTLPVLFSIGKDYKVAKIDSVQSYGLSIKFPKKWKSEEKEQYLLLSSKAFGNGDQMLIRADLSGDARFKNILVMDWFEQTHPERSIRIKGIPAQIKRGKKGLGGAVEYLTSPYVVDVISFQLCDRNVEILLFYFEESAYKSRSKLAYVLESIRCSD